MQHGAPSTLAEMLSSSGPSDSYDSREPPGMIDGPFSAPSSPPDTPVPTKCRPISASFASRRIVSGKCALPASMTMSPSSSSGISSSITASVPAPALTMINTRRGRSSEATKSAIDSDGTNVALDPASANSDFGLGVAAVVDRDPMPVPGEVSGEVAAHHGQAGDTDLSEFSHFLTTLL